MKVRIYRPSKTAMQSGRSKSQQWVLEYELESPRRPEPLMGWTSSEDTLNQVRLNFDSPEDALAFAQKKGWDYTLEPFHLQETRPRNYGDNFRYIPPQDDK